MSDPIPTPFDITDIPHIAWEPGREAWLLALGLFLFAFVALGIAALARSRHPSERSLERLLTQLQGSRVHAPGLECERFSRLCRRILSFLAELDLSGHTAQELRSLAGVSEDPHEAAALKVVALIEDYAYAPSGSLPDRELSDLCENAKQVLASLVQQRRRR